MRVQVFWKLLKPANSQVLVVSCLTTVWTWNRQILRKVRQYVVNCEWGNIRAGRWRNHFISVPCLAGSKLDRPLWLSWCWRMQKNSQSPRKLLSQLNCSQNLLTMSKFIVSKNLLNKFAHGQSWIALHSTCNLSMDSWHNFYLYKNCSKQRKFAHSKGKLLKKIKLLRARICSKNLLTA